VKFRKMALFILAICLLIPNVNAKQLTAVEYFQKIADDAGGDKNSIEVIGDTGLAYDGTVDNNLRYVGNNAKNYIYFNNELWRIIGVMNNIEDENGNKDSYLKIIKQDDIGSFIWNKPISSINSGYGVNDWSNSQLVKLLNPGYENATDPENDSELVNNSLYWNSQSGKCVYSHSNINCNYRSKGLKDEAKQLIKKVVWKTGTISSNRIFLSEAYNEERGEAIKCNYDANYCNDNVERKSSFVGEVGLLYFSDSAFSTVGYDNESRASCLGRRIGSPSQNCSRGSWMKTLKNNSIWLINGLYLPNDGTYGFTSIAETLYANKMRTTDSALPWVHPVVYIKKETKITGGTGTAYNPYTIRDENYNTNNNIEKVTEYYKGDYSIDYLSRNYNVITFGQKNNNLESSLKANAIKAGNVKNVSNIGGAILINGDISTNTEKGTFGNSSNNVGSFIKGNIGQSYSTESKVINNDNYVNFGEMYAQVVNEQKKLVEQTEYSINNESVEITNPGIYMLSNTSPRYNTGSYYNGSNYIYPKKIYIDNYDNNNYYVFNIMNLFETNNYDLYIKSSGDPSFYSFNNFVATGKYTGNIIFNYPNARYIELTNVNGKIIAPKADINLVSYIKNQTIKVEINDSIFANSIVGDNIKIYYNPNRLSRKILDENGKKYVVEPEDYNDDLYVGNYSLYSLLRNYNIVSFGKKDYSAKSKFKALEGYKKGSVGLFHIAGQFLVNGDIGIPNYAYSGGPSISSYNSSTGKIDFTPSNSMRFDLESNLETESYLSGTFKRGFSPKYWSKIAGNTYNSNFGSKNISFNSYSNITPTSNFNGMGMYKTDDVFINFDRLYDNIINEQKDIEKGQEVKINNGKAHIRIGSNYVINNINDVDEIVFDNFGDNKEKLTIITVLNSGDINFPKMSSSPIGPIETNDYYGKKEATYTYEVDRDFNDKYHGNIVWNVPNATYIKLAANAPFAGHLVAPKADVETPELQFAGCFIVNSLYCEGNTEAHFYPLTATKMDEVIVTENGRTEMRSVTIPEALGEEESTIKTEVIGDYNAYLRDTRSNPIREIFTNPKTYTFIGIVVLIVTSLIVGTQIFKRKKKQHS